ncbi:MAG TPA: outer membrane beta-barrel protein [Burkholderiales bacterium]
MRAFKMMALAALYSIGFAGELLAAPSDDIKALLEKGESQAAYELGRKHSDQLGDPAFDFYFGVAAINSGRAGEGVLALERYLLNFPDNVQARLELARGYFVLGEDARSREEFEAVTRLKPPPAVQARIDRYLDAIRSRESRFRTSANLFLEIGVGYDSNINGGVGNANIVLPAFGQVTVTQAGVEQADTFTHLAAGAQVNHPVAPGWSVFGGLGAESKLNHGSFESQFDLLTLAANGGVTLLRENDLYRAAAYFASLDVDSKAFRDITGVAVEWQRQLDEFRSFSAALQYADLDYKGTNDVRDSRLSQVALGYRRAFIGAWQPLLSANLYLGQEDNQHDRDDLSRNLYGFRASVAGSPAPKWAASTGAFYQLSDYRDPDPQLGVTRRDSYYGLDFTVSYALLRSLSLRGEFLYSRNASNIALFEYDRNLVALKLRYDFN